MVQNSISNYIANWASIEKLDQLLCLLEAPGSFEPQLVSVIVFRASDGFTLKRVAGFSIRASAGKKDVIRCYRIETLVGREKEQTISGECIVFKADRDTYLMLTISDNEFVDRVLERLLSYQYPDVFQPILKQAEMRGILEELRRNILPHQIEINRICARRWIAYRRRGEEKRRVASRMDWVKFSLEQAFAEAREEGKWFTRLAFKTVHNGEPTDCRAVLTANGIFQANKWLKQYSKIIDSLIKILESKWALYNNRSREQTDAHKVRPLAIVFEENVFDGKENRDSFISIIKRIPNFGYSIIHSNPYIHLSLVDFKDGSSFELLVSQSKELVIFPQIRATPISLEKVIGHIFGRFNQGEVKDLRA